MNADSRPRFHCSRASSPSPLNGLRTESRGTTEPFMAGVRGENGTWLPTRREFIATTAAAAVAATLPAPAAEAKPTALIDTNVSLGRWPFRRVALDETSALVAKLR